MDTTESSDELIGRLRSEVRIRLGPLAPRRVTGPQWSIAEARLGFRLPSVLWRLYSEVGDGGFGPHHGGLFPVDRFLRHYEKHRRERTVDRPNWPHALLPVCDWGCGIESALDCSDPATPVVRVDDCLDPRFMREQWGREAGPTLYAKFADDQFATWFESPSVTRWLRDWLAGKDWMEGLIPKRPKGGRLLPGPDGPALTPPPMP